MPVPALEPGYVVRVGNAHIAYLHLSGFACTVTPMANTSSILVQKDSRGRVSLGTMLTDDQYIVTRDVEGRVILEPAVVMSVAEQRLLTNMAFLQRIGAAAEEPAARLELDEL